MMRGKRRGGRGDKKSKVTFQGRGGKSSSWRERTARSCHYTSRGRAGHTEGEHGIFDIPTENGPKEHHRSDVQGLQEAERGQDYPAISIILLRVLEIILERVEAAVVNEERTS